MKINYISPEEHNVLGKVSRIWHDKKANRLGVQIVQKKTPLFFYMTNYDAIKILDDMWNNEQADLTIFQAYEECVGKGMCNRCLTRCGRFEAVKNDSPHK